MSDLRGCGMTPETSSQNPQELEYIDSGELARRLNLPKAGSEPQQPTAKSYPIGRLLPVSAVTSGTAPN